ncbi:hypothetical protein B0H10DRAFT_493962 [Mycena sp. CBHHK59/15]|nr:hypothetical protein B0H10DRAFT_493962 [Mycena sp. CBHHK59/15]
MDIPLSLASPIFIIYLGTHLFFDLLSLFDLSSSPGPPPSFISTDSLVSSGPSSHCIYFLPPPMPASVLDFLSFLISFFFGLPWYLPNLLSLLGRLGSFHPSVLVRPLPLGLNASQSLVFAGLSMPEMPSLLCLMPRLTLSVGLPLPLPTFGSTDASACLLASADLPSFCIRIIHLPPSHLYPARPPPSLGSLFPSSVSP